MGIIPERYDVHNRSLRLGANPGSELLGYAAGQLGYAQQTSLNQNVTTNSTDITGLSTIIRVGSNRRVKITGKCHFASSVADDQIVFYILEGVTPQNVSYDVMVRAGVGQDVFVEVIITPSAGLHTYKLAAGRVNGSGTITAFAGASTIAFILVEDIGAA